MAEKGLVDPAVFVNIAQAIREKNGSTDEYKPREMADAIRQIPTGSGGTAEPHKITLKPTANQRITINYETSATFAENNYYSSEAGAQAAEDRISSGPGISAVVQIGAMGPYTAGKLVVNGVERSDYLIRLPFNQDYVISATPASVGGTPNQFAYYAPSGFGANNFCVVRDKAANQDDQNWCQIDGTTLTVNMSADAAAVMQTLTMYASNDGQTWTECPMTVEVANDGGFSHAYITLPSVNTRVLIGAKSQEETVAILNYLMSQG